MFPKEVASSDEVVVANCMNPGRELVTMKLFHYLPPIAERDECQSEKLRKENAWN
jgi:hypothetical protein